MMRKTILTENSKEWAILFMNIHDFHILSFHNVCKLISKEKLTSKILKIY